MIELAKKYPIVRLDIDDTIYDFYFDTGSNANLILGDSGMVAKENDRILFGYLGKDISGNIYDSVICRMSMVKMDNEYSCQEEIMHIRSFNHNNMGLQFISHYDWILDRNNSKIYAKLIRPHDTDKISDGTTFYKVDVVEGRLEIVTHRLGQDSLLPIGTVVKSVGGVAITSENICEYKDMVNKMLNTILENLIDVLPKMDEELLDTYKKTLDISDIKALWEEIQNKVESNAFDSADENVFPQKGDILKEQFEESLNELLISDKYKCSEDIDDSDFAELVRKMKSDIKNEITDTLLYAPNDRYSDWSVYAKKTSDSNPHGLEGVQTIECHRLWVEIIKRYEKIDDYFKTKMENFKSDIMEALKKNTKNLICGTGSEAITNLIVLMEKVGLTDNMIYSALKYLEPIRQDFRQNVYPFLIKDNVHKILLPISKDGYAKFELRSDNKINDTKLQLQSFAINANKQIADTIINYNVFNFYLYGTLDNFHELIINSKRVFDANEDYKKCCSRFRSQLYPSEYGQESDNVKLQELKILLNNSISLINKI